MTKILSISNDIKINKDNVELPYTKVIKKTLSSTSVTFNLATYKSEGVVLVLGDLNYKPSLALVATHDGVVGETTTITGNLTLTKTDTSLTVTAQAWSVITLIDFSGNIWS